MNIAIPSLPKDIAHAMTRVSQKVQRNACWTAEIVHLALTANPANFRKHPGLQILMQLSVVCGIAPLTAWLEQHKASNATPTLSLLPVQVAGDTAAAAGAAAAGSAEADVSLSALASTPAPSELEVEAAANLLGQLAHDLGLLPDGDEGKVCLIQLSLLLRLLAGASDSDSGRVKVIEVISPTLPYYALPCPALRATEEAILLSAD